MAWTRVPVLVLGGVSPGRSGESVWAEVLKNVELNVVDVTGPRAVSNLIYRAYTLGLLEDTFHESFKYFLKFLKIFALLKRKIIKSSVG